MLQYSWSEICFQRVIIMQEKLLVVDDEKDIVMLLKDYFELHGYLIYTAANGKEALEKIKYSPDLILLDVAMPELDGFELCKKIREHITCPIVFLTARVDEQDRIHGLMIGGDDYIMKPFSIDELGARVFAHLRREERKSEKTEVAFDGQLVFHYAQRSVFIDSNPLALTKTEYEILEFLSLHKGQVFSKEAIYEKIWGYEKDGDSTIIIEHIRRIRMKIAKYTEKNYIDTVWGVGYKWTC